MHTRMRSRVRSLLQVLNRAKVEPFTKTAKKTISGKTFKRRWPIHQICKQSFKCMMAFYDL